MYAWDSEGRNTWNSSAKPSIKDTLNSTFLNSFSAAWQNKIATHSWAVGGGSPIYLQDGTAKTAYDYEVTANSSSTDSMKIGLMYVSDYGFATSPSYWTETLYDYYNINIRNNNWCYLGFYEWTISQNLDESDSTFYIFSLGQVISSNNVSAPSATRPCFYLNSNVTYVSGTGTQSDPFRIQ